MPTLRDLLTAPFMFRSESLAMKSGGWSRVGSYPELGCSAKGENMMEVVDELELQRVRALVKAVEDGRTVVPMRAPLADEGVEQLLTRAGLVEWISRLDEEVPFAGDRSTPAASRRGRS